MEFKVSDFKKEESELFGNGTKGTFFIKGIIHITEVTPTIDFEVDVENFFYTGLEKRGEFLSQDMFDIYLGNELKELDWGFEPKLDSVYAVLYEFSIHTSQDYFGEYDMDVNCIRLEFEEIDISIDEYFLN